MDCIITDPPAGIGFIGSGTTGIAAVNLQRNFEFSFRQLLAIAREWRKGGYDKIDCPECNGEGVL